MVHPNAAQEAQAALDNIYELTYMLDTIDEVEHQLEPDSNSFPVGASAAARIAANAGCASWLMVRLGAGCLPCRPCLATCALRPAPKTREACCPNLTPPAPLVRQACRSRPLALLVPPAVLRLRGYTPYTVQMRLTLIDSTAEMALVAATGIAAIWLPTVGAKVVAVGAAAATLLRLAATTRQLWVKDDVPQRRRDIKQLEDSLREARSMAEDGGIVAGLAGAMAGKLKATLQRAEEALSAIERQPAAQQQPQQPPHQVSIRVWGRDNGVANASTRAAAKGLHRWEGWGRHVPTASITGP